jgi:hypothetical protein
MKTTTKTKIILQSTEMIYAPSIFAWAMNGYSFAKDRSCLRQVMKSWTELSDDLWDRILSGKIPHKIVGDTVHILLEE